MKLALKKNEIGAEEISVEQKMQWALKKEMVIEEWIGRWKNEMGVEKQWNVRLEKWNGRWKN